MEKERDLRKEGSVSFNPLSRTFRRVHIKNSLNMLRPDKPIDIKLNINFIKGSKKTKIDMPNKSLESDFETLRKNEEKILKWLSLDEKNKINFARDPIDALYKSKIITDIRLLENIDRFRRSNLKAQASTANIRFKSVTVKAPI